MEDVTFLERSYKVLANAIQSRGLGVISGKDAVTHMFYALTVEEMPAVKMHYIPNGSMESVRRLMKKHPFVLVADSVGCDWPDHVPVLYTNK